MKVYLSALLVALTLFACGSCNSSSGKRKPAGQLISALSPAPGSPVKAGGKVTFTVRTAQDADSVAIRVSGQRILLKNNELSYKIPAGAALGKMTWEATAYAKGDSSSRRSEVMVYAASAPRQYGYKVLNTYPHSTESYTQGLLWHDGFLYESTGLEGKSSVFKVDLKTGRALQFHNLEAKYFGEGLALVGDSFYQLTWQNGTAFVYDAKTLNQTGQFSYSGEGWGLATDGQMLYMSDGSDMIHMIDPATFRIVRSIQVCTDRTTVSSLNELEWIAGELWANVFTTSVVVRIDPATGRVTGVIDFTGILPDRDITDGTDVMNGIAYDPRTKKIYVTGKNWSKLFEIELKEKR